MPANEYEFLTEWHIAAPRELVYEMPSLNHLAAKTT